jgi:hypothetical protein
VSSTIFLAERWAYESKQTQMGINWAATLIAGVSLLLAVFPFIFYKYGPRIRSGSSFAPCMVSPGIFSPYTWVGCSRRHRISRSQRSWPPKREKRRKTYRHGLWVDDWWRVLLDIISVPHALSRHSELQPAMTSNTGIIQFITLHIPYGTSGMKLTM